MKTILAALLALAILGGGHAPAQAGHDEGTPPLIRATMACITEEAASAIVEAAGMGTSADANREWRAQRNAGLCKAFPPGMFPFWFDRIVREDLKWSDGDPMYVVQGHDQGGLTVFAWGAQSEIAALLRRLRDWGSQAV